MSETVRVYLPVVRDDEGRVCCKNDRYEECVAFSRRWNECGDVVDFDCWLDGASGCDDGERQIYRPILEMDCCPIVNALRAEERS